MVTILDHFDRKIIRLKSSHTIRKAQDCYFTLIFYLHSSFKFSRLFDNHNNQHSPQQGVGKFDNEYAQIMCCVGCSNIKCV